MSLLHSCAFSGPAVRLQVPHTSVPLAATSARHSCESPDHLCADLRIGTIWLCSAFTGGLVLGAARPSRRHPLRSVSKTRCSAAFRDSYGEPVDIDNLSYEEQRALVDSMDGMAPYRYIVGFLGLLLVGKAIPDALFAVLRNAAGMQNSTIDPGMMGLDAFLTLVGGAMIWAALTLLGPPDFDTVIAQAKAAQQAESAEGRAEADKVQVVAELHKPAGFQ
eukprot:TRINITY_DN5554_c0_g1_i1.p2 TRINITY_DN5554_c0_g1~~TRINITY_DN5554_c0_g1_i1.p2  ORF type:complete len:220 (-),score=32.66 TRINITY_DN5554_c0_g1_i1:363-1022(-)